MPKRNVVRQILTSACCFCTLISVFFCFFAAVVNEVDSLFDEVGISFRQFLLILLFSFLIALANLILKIGRIHFALRVLIHFSTLLAAFLVVFFVAGNLNISGPASFFVAVVIFTVLYALFFLAAFLFRRFLDGGKRTEEKRKADADYRPRFK